MSIISKLTEKLTGGADGKGSMFNINIPSVSLGGIIPVVEGTNGGGLSDLANSVTKTMENLNRLGNMAYCLGEMILHPDMMLGVLDNIASSMLAVATEIAGRLVDCVMGQVLQAFGTVVGSITNLLNSILDFMNAVLKLFATINNLIESLFKDGKKKHRTFLNREDCTYMFANMAKCMLNKLIGDKLQKFEDKAISKITEVGQDINTSLAEGFQDVNDLGNFVSHESFLMNKASNQLAMFC